MEINLLRKITVKSVFGQVIRPKEGDKQVDIIHCIGSVSGVRDLEDKFKPGQLTYALRGQFEAVNLTTGEVFTAPEAFLPDPTQSMLAELVRKGETDLQFAVTLSYKFSKNAIGYEYVTKHHVKASSVDALSNLRALLPQLAAPTDAPTANVVTKQNKKAA